MSETQWFGDRKPSRRDDIVARLVVLARFWAIASGVVQLLFLVAIVSVSGTAFTFTVFSRSNIGYFELDRGLVAVLTTGLALLGIALATSSWTLWHGGRRGGEALAVLAIMVAALSVYFIASGAVDFLAGGSESGPGMWILLPSALGWLTVISIVTIRRGRNRKGAHVRVT